MTTASDIASTINDVLIRHHVSRSTGRCDCGYEVPLGGSLTEHQAGLVARAVAAADMGDDPFAGAAIFLAATVDDYQMTDDEAARFWAKLATYALDTAAQGRDFGDHLSQGGD